MSDFTEVYETKEQADAAVKVFVESGAGTASDPIEGANGWSVDFTRADPGTQPVEVATPDAVGEASTPPEANN